MKWRVILQPDPETGDYAVWCPELPIVGDIPISPSIHRLPSFQSSPPGN